jgi:DHA1 family tetracycline resistance protein-like MFS transporter
MKHQHRAVLLPFMTMLGSMVVVPAIRPALAASGAGEGAMHAFMSVNMLGAAVGAPLLSWVADRRRAHREIAITLAVLDALLIAATTFPIPVWAILLTRTLQGAANVGLLSILMAMATRAEGAAPQSHARLGATGAVMTAAIAIGPPLGGVLLGLGPRAPFFAAALLDGAVGSLLALAPASAKLARRAPRARLELSKNPLLAVPLVMAFTERFTVGCFVVSFAVYAHESLGLSDRATSLRFTLFVVPFALAMFPMWRAAERFSRARTLAWGGVGYGLAFLLLAVTRGPALDLSLVLCGVSSAMMFAPSLCYAGALSPSESRATSMALFNAAGCLGMMFGPAVAGILSATLRSSGYDAGVRYPIVFAVAGSVQLVAMLLLRRRLRALGEREADILGPEVAS